MDSNDLINNEDLFEALKQEPDFAWPSIILFLICAGFIFGATWAAIYGHISYLAACLINGTSGYFLFSPMHDAIHSSLGRSKQLNLWVGRISFLFYSSLVAFELMRFIHFRHHRNANGDGDEADGVIQSGPGWFRPFKWPFLDLIYVMRPWLVINGYLTELLMLWIIPQRISFFLIAFIFVYLPHVPNDVSEQDNAYRATSIREGMEWFLSPLMMYQNYHLVHHLYPNVPFYRIVKLWNSRLDEHLSHDPAIVPIIGLYPRPANTGRNDDTLEIGDAK